MSFCDLLPDIAAGESLYIGAKTVAWGGIVCLNDTDINQALLATGPYLGGSAELYASTFLCSLYHVDEALFRSLIVLLICRAFSERNDFAHAGWLS